MISKTKTINYKADALILHKTYIQNGKYRFKDPTNKNRDVFLTLDKCDSMSIKFGKKEPKILADEKTLKLASFYSLKCTINVDNNLLLFPAKDNRHDWPRTQKGREFLEDVFLNHLNYFFDNILHLSDKKNLNHQLFTSVRPIGAQDIISIHFSLNNKVVAAQGNPLLRLLALHFDDDAFWPKSGHVTRSFRNLPAESNLLLRASSLVNIGFYQEALLIAFSVLDAKAQELIEDRMYVKCGVDKKETKKYLRNISQERMGTIVNFLMKCIDNVSLKEKNPDLFNQLEKINSKRNQIVHSGGNATRSEAKNAILTVAKILLFFNNEHKAKFNIPEWFLDEQKFGLWF